MRGGLGYGNYGQRELSKIWGPKCQIREGGRIMKWKESRESRGWKVPRGSREIRNEKDQEDQEENDNKESDYFILNDIFKLKQGMDLKLVNRW